MDHKDNYRMMYTEGGQKRDKLVHSTPGCKKKWINTKG